MFWHEEQPTAEPAEGRDEERAATMIQSQVRAKQARQEAARRRQAKEESDSDGGAEHVRNLLEDHLLFMSFYT